jgi:hypothetical protein
LAFPEWVPHDHRQKDVIIINSVKYYCHEISVVEELDGVVTSQHRRHRAVRTANSETDRLAIFSFPPGSG